jgi:hypothetical protein
LRASGRCGFEEATSRFGPTTGASGGGPLVRLFACVAIGLLAACAPGPKGEPLLRPGPQRLPYLRAQGDLVIATLDGIAVTVQPVPGRALEAFFARRSGAITAFTAAPAGVERPLGFMVRIENRGNQRLAFDPAQAFLIDQRNQRTAVFPYDELYRMFSESEQPAKALQVLDDAVLTGFLVVPPKLERAGLLIFPPPPPDARLLILELASLYIGSTEQLLLFEFEVHRSP